VSFPPSKNGQLIFLVPCCSARQLICRLNSLLLTGLASRCCDPERCC